MIRVSSWQTELACSCRVMVDHNPRAGATVWRPLLKRTVHRIARSRTQISAFDPDTPNLMRGTWQA